MYDTHAGQRPRVSYRFGTNLCLLGGALCIVGIFVPWITYHLEGGYLTSTLNGWQAVIGTGSIFSFAVGGVRINSVLGFTIFTCCLFPLLMAAVALAKGTHVSFRAPERLQRYLWPAEWFIIIIGTLELILITYVLDPFGVRATSMWIITHDPPPSLGPGFYMVYAGAISIIVGSVLMGRPQPVQPASAAA